MGKGNCGAFAIAFATSICHSIDPSTVAFSERSLRRHIHECLQSGKMTPFPHTRRHVPRGNEVQISISIYCTCYLHRPGKEMIQCDGCENWFHVDCVCEPKNRAKTAKLVLPRLFIKIEMNTAFTSLSLQTVLFMSVCLSAVCLSVNTYI